MAKALLVRAFGAAVSAVHPATCLPPALPPYRPARVTVLGAGKAAGSMAAALSSAWPSCTGLVITRYGHGADAGTVQVVEGGHPLPDAAGADAARTMLAIAAAMPADDTLVVLLSGGGSALLGEPVRGLPRADLAALTGALVGSGAPISVINTVRRHLLALGGGKLAAATAARVLTYAISDVPGDAAEDIASGPTVADPTTLADARAVLERYRVAAPSSVAAALEDPAHETPKPGDMRLARSTFRLIATNAQARGAASAVLKDAGYPVLDVSAACVTAYSEVLAQAHAERALALAQEGRRCALVWGGETEVRGGLQGASGGANRAYALRLTLALRGDPRIAALAADTDGIDGSADAAGAFVFPDTLARFSAASPGGSAEAFLAAHESGRVFAASGDALVTGPTRTNVADLRLLLIDPDGV